METIEINTGCGKIRGIIKGGCREFLGVRYARAGRFEYADPISSWEGTYDATHFGNACPQTRQFYQHLENPERLFYYREFREGIEFNYDEDCLNLNIYTPDGDRNSPVIIYIHGGGFNSGANSESPFDGSRLAGRGIVTVFINYRVGVLGYLSCEETQSQYGRCGNFGLDDQMVAVKWVKEHIADYGGDPDNITLMGQSAGAMSIQLMCINHANEGLFNRAIMMSGAGLFPKFARPRHAEECFEYWQLYMELAGCGSLDELKTVDIKTLFDAVEKIKALRRDTLLNTMPVVDGSLVSGPVGELIEHPLNIDYMIGCTNNDMYAPALAYIAMKFGRRNGAYMYYFDLDAPGGDGNAAFHSCDLRYAFETLDKSRRPYSSRDYKASRQLASYIANFARCGDPNGSSLPWWNKASGSKPVLCFGPEYTQPGSYNWEKLTKNFITIGNPKAN